MRIKALARRQEELHSNMRFFYFCYKGVAGFVVPTKKVKAKPTINYLWLNRDEHRNWDKNTKNKVD